MCPKLVVNKFQAGQEVQSMIITFYDDAVKTDEDESAFLYSLNGSTKRTIYGPWVTGMTSPLGRYEAPKLIIKQIALDEKSDFDFDSITQKIVVPQKQNCEPYFDHHPEHLGNFLINQEVPYVRVEEITNESQTTNSHTESNTKEKAKLKIDELCRLLASKNTTKQSFGDIIPQKNTTREDLLDNALFKIKGNNENIMRNITNLNTILDIAQKEESLIETSPVISSVCDRCGAAFAECSEFRDHRCDDIIENSSSAEDFYLIVSKSNDEEMNETSQDDWIYRHDNKDSEASASSLDGNESLSRQYEFCRLIYTMSDDSFSHICNDNTQFVCYICGEISRSIELSEEHILRHENNIR